MLQLTRPSVATLLRGLAAEHQSLYRATKEGKMFARREVALTMDLASASGYTGFIEGAAGHTRTRVRITADLWTIAFG